MHFGGHIVFTAAILYLRENLRWPRSIFSLTEKLEKAQFYLAWTCVLCMKVNITCR